MITLEQPAVRAEADPPSLAPDLGVWLEPESLAGRVAKITLTIDERQLVPVADAGAGAALQPRSLLAVLVYCYAAGIFGSEAIVEQMHEDTHFRALCGDDYSDWQQLRRFRRLNRPVIQHCLEELLARIRAAASALERDVPRWSLQWLASPDSWEPDPRAAIAREANDRLNRAAQLDSMALDE